MSEDQDILSAVRALNKNLEMSQQTQGINTNLIDKLDHRISLIEDHNANTDTKLAVMTQTIGVIADQSAKVYNETFVGSNGSTKSKLDGLTNRVTSVEGKWKWLAGIATAILTAVLIASIFAGYKIATTYYDNGALVQTINDLKREVKELKEKP